LASESQFTTNIVTIFNASDNTQEHIYHTLYWLNAGNRGLLIYSSRSSFLWKFSDRFYWVSFDPVNVAEGLFAIASIFSFSRICFLLPAFQHLGPLQISLGRMMSVRIRTRRQQASFSCHSLL
jgi:hypothetical protein